MLKNTIFDIRSLHLLSLYPKTIVLGECIESQLKTKHPKLVQWFRMVELPRIAGLFIPLFKKWSLDYAGRFVPKFLLLLIKVVYFLFHT